MKKLFTLLFISVYAMNINAQNNEFTIKSNTNAGVFEFATEVLDFGEIAQNSDGQRVFKFKNTGKAPIIITKVKSSCGCAVPEYPKRPIMPGESAEMKVKYDTKRIGAFSKSITIYSNASEKVKMLKIKGKVLGKGVKPKQSLEKPKSLMSVK